ncbi:MAG TPA: rhomboid family intramembrane serine protease [Cellvibrio sp.]|nr:rhomboid family intramembrane serine protease [Cellvibrio sp.]
MNWIAVKYFPLEQDLSALSNHLRERGLQHRIAEENGQQCLAVLDNAVVPALQKFLDQYAQGQVDLHSVSTISPPAESGVPTLIEQAAQVPVVICLIVFSAVGALLVETVAGKAWLHYFTFQDFTGSTYIPLSDSLARGEIWRLFTPAFLHFGIFHVLFNSLWMWDLGRRLEFLVGRWHFLLFFAITAVAANVAQYLWSGSANFGGMSGVVYALVGFIAVRQRLAPHPLVDVPPALIGFMLFWLVLCMTGAVDFFISGSVANAAHVGGLVAGCVYAFLTKNGYRR